MKRRRCLESRALCAPRARRSTQPLSIALVAASLVTVGFGVANASPLPGALPMRAPASSAATPQSAERASWIWTENPAGENSSIELRTRFALPADLASARLFTTADNQFELRIDGLPIASSSEWERVVERELDTSDWRGELELRVWAHNDGGPGGFVCDLELRTKSGETSHVRSGSGWSARVAGDGLGPDEGWRPAAVLAAFGDAPWGTPEERQTGEPPVCLAAEDIELPAGFEAELVYSVPRVRQGSWVALALDPSGRLYASDQFGSLWRTELPASGTRIRPESVERVEVEVGEAHGLLWAFDSLWVVVCSNRFPSGVWRLRDTDGDERLDASEHVLAFRGSGEHGPHALRLSPDGRSLYLIAGNHTPLPAIDSSRVPRIWAEDQTLPRRPDPRGHAAGVTAPGGWICRFDPDASHVELIASGMRNAYDFDFDARGEILTFDSDMEWDVGLPWYRPTRVLHLVSGADFGWRHGSGKWPAYFPDSLPAVVDIGLGSPTGVMFGHRTNFGGRWRDALFVADWAYGRIHAVHLVPNGASYAGTSEVFAAGRPLPVTDMIDDGAGALLFATGGRRTQSGLYRVRWTGEGLDGERASRRLVDATHPDGAASRGVETGGSERLGGGSGGVGRGGSERQASEPTVAMRLRRSLESGHRALPAERAPAAIDAAWPLLDSPDRFLAAGARTLLEHQAPELWHARVAAETRPAAQVQAWLALIRTLDPVLATAHYSTLVALPFEARTGDALRDWMRVLGLAFARWGQPLDTERASLLARLEPLYPSGIVDLDRELCRILVRLESAAVVEPTIELIEESFDQKDQIHFAWCLRTQRAGWTAATRRRLLAWLNREAVRHSGGASFQAYLDDIREDFAAGLDEEQRAELADVLAKPPADVEAATARAFVREWSLDDLVDALPRVQSGRDFRRGKRAFLDARCLECHRISGRGGSTGPDLTGAGARFSAREVLESILEPSKVVSDQYRETELVLEDGELIVGRIESETPETLLLRTLPAFGDGQELLWEFDREVVAERRPHAFSRMPEGLASVLDEEELLDLLAFVLNGGDASAPAFAAGGD